jgi:putative PEP-CTERM system histidine kinase
MNGEGLLSPTVAVLFGLISLFLIIRKRSGTDYLLAVLLIVLALITLFDGLTLSSGRPSGYKIVVLYLKSLLPTLILGYGILFSRGSSEKSYYRFWTVPLLAGLMFPVVVIMVPIREFYQDLNLLESRIVPLGPTGYWFYLGIMVYCIAALAILENTFGSSSSVNRWKIKYEFFGMVGILGVLIFYFSQGLLFRAVNMNLLPVRSGVFLLSGVFIGFSRVFRGGGATISVSRFVIYRSLTLMVVGLYLLALGLAGSSLKYFGVALSTELMLFLGIGSGLFLLLALCSEQLRRRAKVFVSKNFYAQKYDYRSEWLKFSESLMVCRSIADVQNVVIQTYSTVFGIEGTAFYLFDRKHNLFRLTAMEREGEAPAEFAVSPALRSYLLDRNRVLNVQGREFDLLVAEREQLTKAEVWLVVPIVSHAFIEGLVMLRRRLIREELTFEDYDMMKTLARQAGLSLMSYRLSAELAEAGEMAAIAKVSSFVVHDLKNVAYTFSLMLENAEKYLGEEEFQRDLLTSIKNTVAKMNGLIMKLKTLPKMAAPCAESIDLGFIARETVRQFSGLKPGLKLVTETSEVHSCGDATEIGKVVLNLLLNAADAVGERGEIRVSTGLLDGAPYIRVRDNGSGMNDYFLKNHLFRPFRTTKDGGLGIGLYQCSQIVESHRGRIDVTSEVGKGTTFTVYLPANCS